MDYEFRLVVPDTTHLGPPVLQVRSCVIQPHWGEWETVPLVVVPQKQFTKYELRAHKSGADHD